jgi:uncharacterized protein
MMQMISTLRALLAVVLLAACSTAARHPQPSPAAAPAAEKVFVLRHQGTAVAVETVTREGQQLQGTVEINEILALSYQIELGDDEAASSVRWSTWQPGRPASTPHVIRFSPQPSGAAMEVGETASQASLPWFDQSAAMIEQIVRLARHDGSGRVEVRLHRLIDGRLLVGVVTFIDARNATFEAGGRLWRLGFDSHGSLLAGQAAEYGVTIDRLDRRPPDVRQPWPAYGTPEGATYLADEVRIPAPEGHQLAGTLTLPRVPAPHPAVILITGGSRHNRNNGAPPAVPFRDIADVLSSSGIAVLRLDDRGVGESTGDAATSTTGDETDDIRTALAWLRRHEQVAAGRIGLVGWSEGGMIAPMIAADDSDLAAVVAMNGPVSGLQAAQYQFRHMISTNPAIPPSEVEAAVARLLASQQQHTRAASIVATDVREQALRVRPPVLLLAAANDRHVEPSSAVELAALLREGGNRDVSTRLFPGLNHMFLPDPDGAAAAWPFLPSTRLPEAVTTALATWLLERL